MQYNKTIMSSQVFYRKWRPQTLAELSGQEQVAQTLRNALASGRLSHAYLFCGPRGTGKTSTGRILAKAVNCLTNGKGEPCNTCPACQSITEGRSLDVIEIDAASNTGVDDIRSLREKVNYAPNQARFKVYIIDEVHMLSNSASNALLKTLEEPPPHVIFVLATTETHKLLPTIISRCQRFDFHRISQADIVGRLSQVCTAEGIKMDPEALKLISRQASGSLRDALNILEQLTAYYGAEISLVQVRDILGITGDARVKELAKHIAMSDVPTGMATISSISGDGLELRQFNRELVEYLRRLLLVKSGAEQSVELTSEDVAELRDLAGKTSLAQILKAVKLFSQLELGFDSYSTLPLELALVECTLPIERETDSTRAEPPPRTANTARPKVASTSPTPVRPAVTGKTVPVMAKPVQPTPVKAEPVAAASAAPVVSEQPLAPLVPGKELEYLTVNWKRMLSSAPKSTAIAILNSSGVTLMSLEKDTVVISFQSEMLKEKMEKSENQKVAEEIISKFLGQPYHVRCVYRPKSNHMVRAAMSLGAQKIDTEEK